MTESRLILLRHGETVWNRESRIQGHRDSPLNATGIAQAEALAQRLAGETFAALYSSDLGRARETAERIAARTSHHIILDPDMRERNLGVLQTLTHAEAQASYPEAYTRYRTFSADYLIPGGESAQQFVTRVVTVFSGIAKQFPGKTVVAVTHGGVLDAMYRHATGAPLHGARTTLLLNASFNCFVRTAQGHWSLPVWGDVTHLPDRSPDDL